MGLPGLTRRDFGALAATTALLPGIITGNDVSDEDNKGSNQEDNPVRNPATAPRPSKSMAIYVGSDLTADGSTILGGFGHEQSSHWIQVVPHQQFPADATTTRCY